MKITVENLTYSYNGRPVVNGVSLSPREGEVTAILGPNGAGKTTLLRCITGALRPVRGTARLDGQSIDTMSPREKARRVALVPQGSSLEFRFTVLETVLMGRYPWLGRFAAESARDHEIARQVIGEVGLAAFCDRPVTALSGGELQRVLVARALCQDTPALLLDEPVSHLDIRHQVDILSTVRRRADERGVTVLCVLHDLNLAARFAHRMVVMKDGRVVAEGVPDHVLDPALIGEVYGLPVTRIDAGDRPVLIPG